MSAPAQTQSQQSSFPELVGRSAEDAKAYISARGLTPELIKPNEPMTYDFRTDRVRIVTDEQGRKVIETPNSSVNKDIMFSRTSNQRSSFPQLVGRNAQQAASFISAQGLNPVILGPNDPTTRDLRFDRVRIVVDPARNVVIEIPRVG